MLSIITIGTNAQIRTNPTTIGSAIPATTRNVGMGNNTPLGGLHMLTGVGRNSNSSFIFRLGSWHTKQNKKSQK